jgi:hypothetical protein
VFVAVEALGDGLLGRVGHAGDWKHGLVFHVDGAREGLAWVLLDLVDEAIHHADSLGLERFGHVPRPCRVGEALLAGEHVLSVNLGEAMSAFRVGAARRLHKIGRGVIVVIVVIVVM